MEIKECIRCRTEDVERRFCFEVGLITGRYDVIRNKGISPSPCRVSYRILSWGWGNNNIMPPDPLYAP